MSEKQGYRHFDLPVDWLEKSGGWVPPKSQDPIEIAELRELPPGSLILRRQRVGVDVAAHMLDFMSREDIEAPGVRLLATAGLVTAWHNLAEDAEHRMRKVTKLPVHVHTEGPITQEGLVATAAEKMHEATDKAALMSREKERKGSLFWRVKNDLGRRTANASLTLASAPYATILAQYVGDDATMQHYAREGALRAKRQAVELRPEIGVYPSMAQLSERFAPLPVHIQNIGHPLVREALEYAQTEVFETAPAA